MTEVTMKSVHLAVEAVKKSIRLESALVRRARNKQPVSKLKKLPIVSGVVSRRTSALSKRIDFFHGFGSGWY
jgi:hypothetical protein